MLRAPSRRLARRRDSDAQGDDLGDLARPDTHDGAAHHGAHRASESHRDRGGDAHGLRPPEPRDGADHNGEHCARQSSRGLVRRRAPVRAVPPTSRTVAPGRAPVALGRRTTTLSSAPPAPGRASRGLATTTTTARRSRVTTVVRLHTLMPPSSSAAHGYTEGACTSTKLSASCQHRESSESGDNRPVLRYDVV
ncbi:hypothetical protein BD413DRAFT_557182, partial [Trametes elegans]